MECKNKCNFELADQIMLLTIFLFVCAIPGCGPIQKTKITVDRIDKNQIETQIKINELTEEIKLLRNHQEAQWKFMWGMISNTPSNK